VASQFVEICSHSRCGSGSSLPGADAPFLQLSIKGRRPPNLVANIGSRYARCKNHKRNIFYPAVTVEGRSGGMPAPRVRAGHLYQRQLRSSVCIVYQTTTWIISSASQHHRDSRRFGDRRSRERQPYGRRRRTEREAKSWTTLAARLVDRVSPQRSAPLRCQHVSHAEELTSPLRSPTCADVRKNFTSTASSNLKDSARFFSLFQPHNILN